MNSGKNKPQSTILEIIKLKVRNFFTHKKNKLRIPFNGEKEKISKILTRKIIAIPNITIFCIVFIIFLIYYYVTKGLSTSPSKIGYIALYFLALAKVLKKARIIKEKNLDKNNIKRVIAEKTYNIDFCYKLIIVLLGLIGALIIIHL